MGWLKVVGYFLLAGILWGLLAVLVIVGFTLVYSWDVRWMRRTDAHK